MLPDPLALRGAADVLVATADQVGGRAAALTATVGGLRWSGPLVDDLRRRLAAGDAAARTGCLGLTAGAAHLRALAAAVEQVRARSRRLHAAAEIALLEEIRTAPNQIDVLSARLALRALADPDDPAWARRSGVGPISLPAPAEVRPVAVVPSPPGRVEADVDAVHRLASTARASASAVSAQARTLTGRTFGLVLHGLDAYGMAGSRSAEFLLRLTAPGSPLATAASVWADAGDTCALLAELLAAADSGAALLADPRLPLAVQLLAAVRSGGDALRPALAAVDPDDRAWLAATVPGLAERLAEPARSHPAWWWQPGPLDAADGMNGLLQVPAEMGVRLRAQVVALVGRYRGLRALARTQAGAAAAATRAAAAAVLAAARELRAEARRVQRLADQLRVPAWLRSATTLPVADLPLLRHVSRSGAAGAGLGIWLDLRDGIGVPLAVAKGAAGLAAGAAAGAAVAGALAAAPVVVVVVGVLAAGAVASVVASGAVARFGPALWRQVERAGRVVGGLGRSAAGAGGRASAAVGRAGAAVGRWRDSAGAALGRWRVSTGGALGRWRRT